jgi:DNA-binding winged helix-turn-helix (wHTH) protein
VDIARAPSTWTHPDGRVVRLRPMEARLLAYLRARSGEVVSVRELLTNVWEYSGGVESRTVNTTMSRLRASIEPDPKRPRWIVTVPGGGFRWVANSAPTATRRVSLPAQRDRFIERPETDAALALLLAGHRLLTLAGLGGIGKTRTALTIAERATDVFVGGVDLVDLTSCTDGETLHQRIASALDIHVPRGHAAVEQAIVRSLATRAGALVILDNAEHAVAELAALIRAVLDEPSGATLLVTSRTFLDVPGEKALPIGPLSLEPSEHGVSPAAALLLDRTTNAGITVAPADAERIVGALDGIPLAIELAAARARSIPARDLARALDEGTLPLLRRTEPGARHSSLDAVLEQSWGDLDADLQACLACLTVLEGTFSFALARAVMPPTPPAADALEELVSCGMLQFDGTSYRMLAPVAQALRRKSRLGASALERLDDYLTTIPLGSLWERRVSSRTSLRKAEPYLRVAWVRAWHRGQARAARSLLERAYAMNELRGQQELNPELADEVIETASPAEHASLILARANLTTTNMARQLAEAIDWSREALDPWTECFARAYRAVLTSYGDDDDVRALDGDASTPPALQLWLTIARYHYDSHRGHGTAEARLADIEGGVALSRFALNTDLELLGHLFGTHAHALVECGRYEAAAGAADAFERWLPDDADLAGRAIDCTYYTEVYCMAGMLDRAERRVARLTADARRSGSVNLMGRMARAASRIKAERGEEHAAFLLAREAVRNLGESGWAADQRAALRDLAKLELRHGRTDRARATLAEAGPCTGPLHTFLGALLLLECDLLDSFGTVPQERVVELLAQSTGRGARTRATVLALHSWWLAGNGAPHEAREGMREAWAILGPVQGLEREAIARIDGIVDSLTPRMRAARLP